jgi:hypothetical protein
VMAEDEAGESSGLVLRASRRWACQVSRSRKVIDKGASTPTNRPAIEIPVGSVGMFGKETIPEFGGGGALWLRRHHCAGYVHGHHVCPPAASQNLIVPRKHMPPRFSTASAASGNR